MKFKHWYLVYFSDPTNRALRYCTGQLVRAATAHEALTLAKRVELNLAWVGRPDCPYEATWTREVWRVDLAPEEDRARAKWAREPDVTRWALLYRVDDGAVREDCGWTLRTWPLEKFPGGTLQIATLVVTAHYALTDHGVEFRDRVDVAAVCDDPDEALSRVDWLVAGLLDDETATADQLADYESSAFHGWLRDEPEGEGSATEDPGNAWVVVRTAANRRTVLGYLWDWAGEAAALDRAQHVVEHDHETEQIYVIPASLDPDDWDQAVAAGELGAGV